MQEPDFWTASAETMELTIEGNRLIAREIADLLRRLGRDRFGWSSPRSLFERAIDRVGRRLRTPS